MIRKFITPLLLFISTFSFAQDVLKATRSASSIKIDGDASEWHLPLRYYDNTTKLFFDFSNDDNNLYLCFQSQDDMGEMKIMRAGMTVTIKIKGGGKASIKFPLHQTASDSDMMEVKGFRSKDGVIPANDRSGINAAMKREKKLTYEISIPLKELSGDDFAKDFTKDMELSVEIHAMKEGSHTDEKSGKSGNYSGRSGGGGGRRGGMGGGGGGGGGRYGNRQNSEQQDETEPSLNQERSSLYEKTDFKQKFTLAAK